MSEVKLVLLSESHLEAVTALIADPTVQRFTRVPASPRPDFAATWLARYERARVDGTREAFAIEDRLDSSFVGLAVLPRIDRESATAEIGYMVAPAARGRGVATAAVLQVASWSFAEIGMQRLELLVSAANEASKKVAARSGFAYEGTLRSYSLKPGVREHTEIWSRLPSDPDPV